jgi:hypothetical protein
MTWQYYGNRKIPIMIIQFYHFPQIYNFTIIPELCNCIETFKKYHDTTV